MLVVRITLLATLWVVGACTASRGETGSPRPPSAGPDSAAPASVQPSGLPGIIVGPVVAEIARSANVPVDQVTIRSAEAVTFPDGSLGCPTPGMVYTQAQVDGYRIVAEAAGTVYDYRGIGPDRFRRCMKTTG